MKKIIIGLFIISITFSSAKELMICHASGYNHSNKQGEIFCYTENGKNEKWQNFFKLIRKGWSIAGVTNGKVKEGYTDTVTIYLVK